MKKLLLIGLLIFPFIGNAQTTLEEWNYVTKGVRIEMASGLDRKKGYEIKLDYRHTDKHFYVDFCNVLKYGEKVAILIYTNYSDKSTYYCIPKLGNPEVNKLYSSQIYELTRIKNPLSYIIMWYITSKINWN